MQSGTVIRDSQETSVRAGPDMCEVLQDTAFGPLILVRDVFFEQHETVYCNPL
jgi:hypothetical protein